ncbi:chromosome segregation protein SMC [Jonquetella anthropi]|uniref:chromosome segregation protein SMC n=1 Tax=Jonquetella anthropi TaxID=428712 RepID=UPI0023F01942|nr:chromosome segregation protein SMC [Jonquetella anthropi]
MYIERLTLKNFKSFGGTHQMPFAPGFTAIVGPNGSGKSNILDGLRWALGESSASRLRIARQSDLIFQGSAGMVEASEAEVTVQLSDGATHPTLRRSLSQSGAEIWADGVKIRLGDLGAFKEEVGLGGERFAFIGQGEVTEAISQRPKERRLQLEELFGVDRYRRRRDDAALELKEAQDELLRLQTLIGELTARRDEIAPQAALAKRAQELEARLETLNGRLYHLRRFEEERRLADAKARGEKLQAGFSRATWWNAGWSSQLDRLRRRGDEYLKRRAQLQERQDELTPMLENARQAETAAQGTIRENAFALSRLDEEKERLCAGQTKLAQDRKSASARLSECQTRLAELSGRIAELEDRIRRQSDATASRQKKLSELTERRASYQEALADARGRLSGAASSTAAAEARQAELEAEHRRLTDCVARGDRALEALEDRTEELVEGMRNATSLAQDLSMRQAGARRTAASLEGELEAARSSAAESAYPRPVQMVLAAISLGKLDIKACPAAESFECPAELAAAMEAYLGGRQYWLLVEDTASAQKGIDLLKGRSGGRATFLPLERCQARLGALPSGKGVIGRASELVKPAPEWKKAVDHLLGGVLVVEDYATGAALSRGAHFSVVTLEGEVFSPSGAVSGGKSSHAGAISARRQAAELAARLEEAQAASRRLRAELTQAEEAEKTAQEELNRHRAVTSRAKEELEGLQNSLRAVSAELAELEERRGRFQQKQEEWQRYASETESRLKELEREIESLAASPDGNDAAPEDALPQLRGEELLAQERTDHTKQELQRLLGEEMALSSQLVRLENDRRTAQTRLDGAKEQETEALTRRRALEAQMSDLRGLFDELERSGASDAARTERLIRRSDAASARLEKIRAERAAVEADAERSNVRLEEMISASEARWPYPESFAPGDERREAVESAARYAERALRELGPVNVGALDEQASLDGRLTYLNDQTADVKNGIRSLQDVIAQADRQAAELFSKAMDQIDVRFNSLFGRLFGGGEAHLSWQGEAGAWDSGVEITARPPGKKTLLLAQLSGGEQSLTALALLFAAMETAGAPLAVLDEVDAALDEVNLSRFAQLAAEYATRVQLIVMTHRRQTMEGADTMFGVTMSEPGLSQIVSVRTDQWE